MSTCTKAVSKYLLRSPLGQLELSACYQGIHGLRIIGVTSDEDFQPSASQEVCVEAGNIKDIPVIVECVDWLNNYFHHKPKAVKQSPPPICHLLQPSQKAPFTQAVWKTLTADVTFGKTVSYGQLAQMCGSSAGASRAVGQAMKNNQVSLIIPCHRVIKSDGKSGNYSGGKKNSVKVWLLEHEGALKI